MFVFTFFILPSAQNVAILYDIFSSKNMFSSLLNGLHVAAVERLLESTPGSRFI